MPLMIYTHAGPVAALAGTGIGVVAVVTTGSTGLTSRSVCSIGSAGANSVETTLQVSFKSSINSRQCGLSAMPVDLDLQLGEPNLVSASELQVVSASQSLVVSKQLVKVVELADEAKLMGVLVAVATDVTGFCILSTAFNRLISSRQL